MSTGWTCPKCSRVYAPFVAECSKCNATVGTGTGTNPWTPQPGTTGHPMPQRPYWSVSEHDTAHVHEDLRTVQAFNAA